MMLIYMNSCLGFKDSEMFGVLNFTGDVTTRRELLTTKTLSSVVVPFSLFGRGYCTASAPYDEKRRL